jgi:hypothetical protein
VTAGIQPTTPGYSQLSSRLIILALLPTLAWFPPETRGESMAGCAVLVALLALVGWRAGAAQAAIHALLVAATATAAVLASLAFVPAAAVEPVAVGLLAAAAGLAVARSGGGDHVTRVAIAAVAVAAACVALHGLYQKGWGLERLADLVRQEPAFPDREAVLARLGRGRAFASFTTPAALGGYLAMAIPATIGLALCSRGWRRGAWLGAALVGVGAFLAAASATATVALVAAVTLAAALWRKARRSLVVAAAALLLLLVAVAWLRGGRVLDLKDQEGPWRQRAGNLTVAARMATDRPWTGVGPGGFAEVYPAYRRPQDNETRHAHNLPLELLAEWGWPAGTAISLLFFAVFLQPLWRERRDGPSWRRGLAIGLAAFALQNLADFTAFMPSLLWTAAILRGRLCHPVAEGGEPYPGGSGRLLAGCSLATVLLAAGAVAAGGLANNARLSARAAAFAGEPGRGLSHAERAVALAPWNVDAAVLLARMTADVARLEPTAGTTWRLAAERADRAVGLAPVRPAAREARARIRLAAGDVPGAFADLSEAARLYPAHESYAVSRDRLRERLAAVAKGPGP